MQDYSNSSALAMELLQFGAKPSTCTLWVREYSDILSNINQMNDFERYI